MTTRELLVVDDGAERSVGSVTIDDEGGAVFAGEAVEVFAYLRWRHGERRAAERLVGLGWANGMGSMRLGDPTA